MLGANLWGVVTVVVVTVAGLVHPFTSSSCSSLPLLPLAHASGNMLQVAAQLSKSCIREGLRLVHFLFCSVPALAGCVSLLRVWSFGSLAPECRSNGAADQGCRPPPALSRAERRLGLRMLKRSARTKFRTRQGSMPTQEHAHEPQGPQPARRSPASWWWGSDTSDSD